MMVRFFVLVFGAILFLSACSENEVILPGERISISSADEAGVKVNLGASSGDYGLPPASVNRRFEAPGHTVSHRGGHFEVDVPLEVAFSVRVGVGAEVGVEMAQPVANEVAVFTLTPGGVVMASDLATGAMLWRADIDASADETQTSSSGGLMLSGGVLFVHASKERLYAIDAADGSEMWHRDFASFLADGPSVDDGIIILTDLDGRLYALSASDGDLLWSRIGVQDETRITGSAFPAIGSDAVIASGGDGEVIAVGLQNGDFLWGENITPLQLRTALDAIPDLRAHPIHAGGLVIITTPSKSVIAFSATTGREVWRVPLHALEMPWLAGETLYLSTIDGRLYALRSGDGAVRWMTELPGAYDPSLAVAEGAVRYTTPVVVSGQVVIASSRGGASDGRLLSFDALTGEKSQDIRVGGAITTAPIVANKMVYVMTRSGRLVGLR